ncbi:MAG: SGNH/GDSL hydrolase family protein [Candidatus Aureabacteria bacterium]|nr:SGNH/GDSL hydrolase family protein [Candidatus Auribacterota bacterium]
MKLTTPAIAVIMCAPLALSAVGARGAAPEAWVAYPENDRVLARSFSAGSLSEPGVIAAGDGASFAPALAIGPRDLPFVTWLNNKGDILFSGSDGSRWSTPEIAALSRGRHRGIPALAVGDTAVIAWAETENGMFEDIFYAVRTGGRWSEPRRAHEQNNVPDILPSIVAGAGGAFSIRWKSFDGWRYVERYAGALIIPQDRGELPHGLLEKLVEAQLPMETAIVWRGADGFSRSVYLKQLMDEQENAAAGEATALTLDEPTPTPSASKAASLRGTQTETPASPTFTPTQTPVENTATPVGRRIDIIAFGDSITYGRGSSSNGPRTGYPVILQAILNYNFTPDKFHLINEGVPGEETWTGLGRIDSVLDSYDADGILIMEGTNDMFFQISFNTVQENLKQMAFRARSHGVFPVLATLIPTVPSLRPLQYQTTRSFYAGGYVQALSRLYGIPYADQWNAFCSIPSFAEVLMDWATGNHPNDNGYRYVMAPEWYGAIAPYLEPSFRPVGPKITLGESAENVTRGSLEDFSYALVPSNDLVKNAVDCYVALKRPDGKLLYFNSSWQLTSAETPAARGVLLDRLPRSGFLLDLPIAMDYPVGTHTLYVVTVRSLRDPWITSNWTGFASISFEVQ